MSPLGWAGLGWAGLAGLVTGFLLLFLRLTVRTEARKLGTAAHRAQSARAQQPGRVLGLRSDDDNIAIGLHDHWCSA